ncbi:hypothetical protein ACFLUE_01945 [Chloroflexota bacterium]
MQIKKAYQGIGPDLLHNEIKDLILKQDTVLGENKLETYSVPNDSSSFIARGILTFKVGGATGEAVRVHIIGSTKNTTKVLLDVDEKLFPGEKVAALQSDLDFVFGTYEVKHR